MRGSEKTRSQEKEDQKEEREYMKRKAGGKNEGNKWRG